jgi:FkbM family methyltransferase
MYSSYVKMTVKRRFFEAIFNSLSEDNVDFIINSAYQHLGIGNTSGNLGREVENCVELLNSRGTPLRGAIDVGANHGNWSRELLGITQSDDLKVFAFEAGPSAFQFLERNLGEDKRVRLFNVGLSDQKFRGRLISDFAGSPLGSTYFRPSVRSEEFACDEDVVFVPLDDFYAEVAGNVNVMKIDVEGMEMLVLQGARHVLNEIEVVQFEFGGIHVLSRTFFRDFYQFFTGLNFSVWRDSRNGLVRIEDYNYRYEVFSTTNYYARRN